MKRTIKSINPANEAVENEFPDWDMDEITPIIEAADNAFSTWQQLNFTERGVFFINMAKIAGNYYL